LFPEVVVFAFVAPVIPVLPVVIGAWFEFTTPAVLLSAPAALLAFALVPGVVLAQLLIAKAAPIPKTVNLMFIF
jgi:hypothetical protein